MKNVKSKNVFLVKANKRGYAFIKRLREQMVYGYTIRLKYRGPRLGGSANCKRSNATHIAIYLHHKTLEGRAPVYGSVDWKVVTALLQTRETTVSRLEGLEALVRDILVNADLYPEWAIKKVQC